MASAEARQAAIDKAVAQVSTGNGFMRPATTVKVASKSTATVGTKKRAS
jgi:hypothetical protein